MRLRFSAPRRITLPLLQSDPEISKKKALTLMVANCVQNGQLIQKIPMKNGFGVILSQDDFFEQLAKIFFFLARPKMQLAFGYGNLICSHLNCFHLLSTFF